MNRQQRQRAIAFEAHIKFIQHIYGITLRTQNAGSAGGGIKVNLRFGQAVGAHCAAVVAAVAAHNAHTVLPIVVVYILGGGDGVCDGLCGLRCRWRCPPTQATPPKANWPDFETTPATTRPPPTQSPPTQSHAVRPLKPLRRVLRLASSGWPVRGCCACWPAVPALRCCAAPLPPLFWLFASLVSSPRVNPAQVHPNLCTAPPCAGPAGQTQTVCRGVALWHCWQACSA